MIFSKGYRQVLFDPNYYRRTLPKFMHTTLFCSYTSRNVVERSVTFDLITINRFQALFP